MKGSKTLMKNLKKLSGILLAIAVLLACTVSAFAQTENVGGGSGTIKISNAAKGETYAIYKLFDATVKADGSSIAYYTVADIPTGLTAYFQKDDNNFVSATDAAWGNAEKTEMSEGLRGALKDWASGETADESVVSDGSALEFTNVPYCYYVVTTTQGSTLISVDSTDPVADLTDKNFTKPTDVVKTVNKDNVNFGDTVTYTVTFKTSNYNGAGPAAKVIAEYVIYDTLPDFLENVQVTSIIIDNDANFETAEDQKSLSAVQFDPTDKKFSIDWYDDAESKFFYNNGAKVQIKYTAVVTDKAKIAGTGNENTVTVKFIEKDSVTENVVGSDTATISTYALALKKVDDAGQPLADAVFKFPFYVNATSDSDGAYIYAGTSGGDGLTNSLTTPGDGVIVVKGIAANEGDTSYSITETQAPDGYNKLLAPVTVKVVATTETATNATFYIKDGELVDDSAGATSVTVEDNTIAASAVVVVNKTGSLLPSTGGIGTTIFYIVGGVLVAAAVVLLVAKKRTSENR